MPTTIDIRELPQRLNEALALASAGTEVIFVEGVIARARLIPPAPVLRTAGLHAGAIEAADDFDAPLPDDFWTGHQ